jgi:protein-disulfide isomerase
MIGALFDTQQTWAVAGAEGTDKLLQIAKQAGFTKEKFDQCIGDKALFEKIVETRARGHETFGVDSTPTFFVNGKRLTDDQTVAAFEALLGESGPPPGGADADGQAPSAPEAPPAQ